MQRLLLDTPTFLGWLADDPRLGGQARGAIAEPGNPAFVGAATGWEIGINKALGKLQGPDDLDGVLEQKGFTRRPVTFFHGEQAGALPAHHKDPFDRMLVAQA
jgi:PIN domain nuclease of toxin-antitoxin system